MPQCKPALMRWRQSREGAECLGKGDWGDVAYPAHLIDLEGVL